MCGHFIIFANLLMDDRFVLKGCQLLEILLDVGIEVVKGVTVITGFGTEKDHQDPLNTAEWE